MSRVYGTHPTSATEASVGTVKVMERYQQNDLCKQESSSSLTRVAASRFESGLLTQSISFEMPALLHGGGHWLPQFTIISAEITS